MTCANAVVTHAPTARKLLVCGGGALNRHLLQRLAQRQVQVGHQHALDPASDALWWMAAVSGGLAVIAALFFGPRRGLMSWAAYTPRTGARRGSRLSSSR